MIGDHLKQQHHQQNAQNYETWGTKYTWKRLVYRELQRGDRASPCSISAGSVHVRRLKFSAALNDHKGATVLISGFQINLSNITSIKCVRDEDGLRLVGTAGDQSQTHPCSSYQNGPFPPISRKDNCLLTRARHQNHSVGTEIYQQAGQLLSPDKICA